MRKTGDACWGLPTGLYGIVDSGWLPLRVFPQVACSLVSQGVEIVQLRMKGVGDAACLDVHGQVIDALTEAGLDAVLCVNDRPDLLCCLQRERPMWERWALHLGQDDLEPTLARELVGDDVLIGRSTHTLEQVEEAQGSGADYLGFGPVFPTTTKEAPDPTVGVDLLRLAVQRSGLPVVAIGGIGPSRVHEVCHAGVHAMVVVAGLYEGLVTVDVADLDELAHRVRGLWSRIHDAMSGKSSIS